MPSLTGYDRSGFWVSSQTDVKQLKRGYITAVKSKYQVKRLIDNQISCWVKLPSICVEKYIEISIQYRVDNPNYFHGQDMIDAKDALKLEADIADILQPPNKKNDNDPGRHHIVETLQYDTSFYGTAILMLEDFDNLLSNLLNLQSQEVNWFTIARHVALGLEYIHSMGVTHGAIQTHNVACRKERRGGYKYMITGFSNSKKIEDNVDGLRKDKVEYATMIYTIATNTDVSCEQLSIEQARKKRHQSTPKEWDLFSSNLDKHYPIRKRQVFDACMRIDSINTFRQTDPVTPIEPYYQHILKLLDINTPDKPAIVTSLDTAIEAVYHNWYLQKGLFGANMFTSTDVIPIAISVKNFVFALSVALGYSKQNFNVLHKTGALDAGKNLFLTLTKSKFIWLNVINRIQELLHSTHVNKFHVTLANLIAEFKDEAVSTLLPPDPSESRVELTLR